MSRRIVMILFIVFYSNVTTVDSYASDYMVELFEQHYKEKLIVGAGDMKISHTWQVKTIFGNKVIILIGRDYNLRKWIKAYAKKHKKWIVKVPDEGDDRFKYDMAVYLNLEQLQSVRTKSWHCNGCKDGPPPVKPQPAPVTK